ncbi:MAG: Cytochrome c-type biogenesis protein CcmH [Candidatus Erwinia impunctatus]|nr:Cytochrome c-type biogenesis protein CcmH [Culicoides impunctatus]
MLTLWLTLLLLLIVAGCFVLYAARRSVAVPVVSRDTINKSLYHDRLAELQEETRQGRIGQSGEMVQELQQMLLTDIPSHEIKGVRDTRMMIWPGILLLVLVTAMMYGDTGGFQQLQVWHSINQQYSQLRAQVMDPQATPLTMEQMARLGVGLRSELLQHPRRSEDWLMLGRIAMVLNDGQMAKQAFQRALQLAPLSIEAQLGYAEILIRLQHSDDIQQANDILNALYASNNKDTRVINLLAWSAWQQAAYPLALQRWQQLLSLLSTADPRRPGVEKHIAEAKAKIISAQDNNTSASAER